MNQFGDDHEVGSSVPHMPRKYSHGSERDYCFDSCGRPVGPLSITPGESIHPAQWVGQAERSGQKLVCLASML